MADNDDVRPDEDDEEQGEQRLPDLDVTDEAGQAVKGGVPILRDGGT